MEAANEQSYDVSQLGKQLSSLDNRGWAVCLVANPNRYTDLIVALTHYFCNEQKSEWIYVTANKPYSQLVQLFTEKGVSIRTCCFVDTVTKMIGGETVESPACTFITSPIDLSGLGIAISETISKLKNNNGSFLIVDSLSTLLVYNSPDSVIKFSHFTINRAKLYGMRTVMIAMDDIDEHVLSSVLQFCDRLIRIK